MKKLLTYIVIAIIFYSCNTTNEENKIAKVKPSTTTINGDLTKYIEVVDAEYEITQKYTTSDLAIKVKSIKKMLPKELEGMSIEINVTLLDENNMPISGTGEISMLYDSESKIVDLLTKSDMETIVYFQGYSMDYKAQDHADKVKRISVNSRLVKQEYSESGSNPDETTENLVSGSEENDKLIDEYEKLTKSYIELIGNMKNDNVPDAISSYSDILQNTLSLQQKLEDHREDLTPDQLSRMIKIQAKMAKAMN